jgi:hypothetical protein
MQKQHARLSCLLRGWIIYETQRPPALLSQKQTLLRLQNSFAYRTPAQDPRLEGFGGS